MKSRTISRIAILLSVALGLSAEVTAQHTQYKLVDLGTFGGRVPVAVVEKVRALY